MEDGNGRKVEFDVEDIMAEIKIATPEFIPFLVWCTERSEEGEVSADEMRSVFELVYSYAKSKNEDEEAEMMDGRR